MAWYVDSSVSICMVSNQRRCQLTSPDKNGIAQLPVNDHADNQNAFASASAYVTYPTTAEEGPDNVTQDKAVRGATQASDIGAPAKRYPARRKTIVS
jgi:hypothetical protein